MGSWGELYQTRGGQRVIIAIQGVVSGLRYFAAFKTRAAEKVSKNRKNFALFDPPL